MKKLKMLTSYLAYLSRAKSRYVIHSPFVFELVNQVFRDKTRYADFRQLEQVYREQASRKGFIETVDFGTGAGEKKYTTLLVPKGKLVKQRTSGRKQLELLYKLSRHFKPETILELGTAAGISAGYLKKGYPPAKMLTLEGCANLADLAQETFAKLQLENIEVVSGSFDATLKEALEHLPRLDLVFFDGNHRKEPTLSYFHACLPKAGEDSLFVFDDIHWSEGMEEAWEEIKKHEQVSLTIDIFHFGLVFFRKGIARQHFVIKY